MHIIFVGTPTFGAIVLKKLINSDFRPSLVITETDKPAGRKKILTPPPVKILAQEAKIPFLQTEKIKTLKSEIEKFNPDLIVVAAFGQLIPKEIIDLPKFGIINIHPSLLPRWRGASPVQFTILQGDQKTGVTIMLMAEKIDSGPILAQTEINLAGNEMYEELHNRLAEMGGDLLVKMLPDYTAGKITPEDQNEEKVTFSRILTREDGRIDWTKSAEEIERKIRAFSNWPGTYTLWDGQKIKILKAHVLINDHKTYEIGKTLIAPQNNLCVQTEKGFLVIESLQVEGGKEMKSEDFVRGHKDFIGTILR